MEIAVATLATDRALLLLGVPGTAKTWVSEHLAAAISGDSTLLVQGTAGTTEETLRYGWNYARLLAEGPSEAALVPSPIYRAMQLGSIARVEELTRMPSDVQDALVTALSEKSMPVPELNSEVAATRGFNVIATANDRDRGVNDLSSALRRRFNTVVLPLPDTADEEIAIVAQRVNELGAALPLPPIAPAADEIRRVVTVFRELRDGVTATAAPASRCRAARCRRPRRSRSSPTGCRWRPTSATARCRPTTSPPGSSAPSSATRSTTGSPGASTSRRSSPNATAGATSTRPAAPSTERSADDAPPARDPPPRTRVGAVGGATRSTSCSRRSCWSSRRPRPRRRSAGSASSGSTRRWRCSATSSTTRAGPCSPRSPRSAPSGRRSVGPTNTGCRSEAIDLPLAEHAGGR